MKTIPSRTLNEDSLMLGLNQSDIIGIGILFYSFQIILHPYDLDIVSLILSFAFTVFLIGLRLKYRRHIIRDYLFSTYIKFLRAGVFYDPKIDL